MKSLLFMLLFVLAVYADDTPVTNLGAGLTLETQTELAVLADTPEEYLGKKVQVSGTVIEVCANRGCWIKITSGEGDNLKTLFVKVKDGEIVFPQDAIGKTAVVEGEMEKIELTLEETRERAKHRCEMNGEEYDPEEIKEAEVIYRLKGLGAVIK